MQLTSMSFDNPLNLTQGSMKGTMFRLQMKEEDVCTLIYTKERRLCIDFCSDWDQQQPVRHVSINSASLEPRETTHAPLY